MNNYKKNIAFLDFETSYQINIKGKTDPSPFCSENYLVSYGVWFRELSYKCVKHNLKEPDKDAFEFLQNILNNTDLLVAFNAKFELMWLRACGFKYDGPIADPMIRAYVMARGTKLPLSLKECCVRANVTHKKSDLVDQYLKDKVQFSDMPWEIVEEYGKGDVISLKELFEYQLLELDKSPYLWPTIELMEEFCVCLTDIETNGIKIDTDELDKLEKEYKIELRILNNYLEKAVFELMGDTPINLDSPEDLSKVIYSRQLNDKKRWAEIFNIGTELRGSVRKPKRRPKMLIQAFTDYVIKYTSPIKKTRAVQCTGCKGVGRFYKTKIDGSNFKKASKCHVCEGSGFVYIALKEYAGLKIIPENAYTTVEHGFATDKETLQKYIEINDPDSVRARFLKAIIRRSQIETYLNTFVLGIRNNLKNNNILHTKFMQCVTATGRLSSRAPNFQNVPRGSTFEVKKAVISRFKDGIILEADFSQLEFRVAGILSGNKKIAEDIANKIDVHSVTAKFIEIDRQSAKPNTFKPLYGGRPEGESNPKKAAYYKYFIERYDIDSWGWPEHVLKHGSYILPSGRELSFPNTKRLGNGYITNRTQIMNYKTQSYATADLVPIAVIYIWRLFKAYNLRSVLFLTVHDSVEIDCAPEEFDIVVKLVNQGMGCLKDECKRRYAFEMTIPIEWEISQGKNWFERRKL